MRTIYLAGPYTHEDPLVREMRYQKLLKAEATLLNRNLCVLNPIGMCHVLAEKYNLPTGYEYWQERDRELINRADAVFVLMMHGWEASVGVTDEIKHAEATGKPVIFYTEGELLQEPGVKYGRQI